VTEHYDLQRFVAAQDSPDPCSRERLSYFVAARSQMEQGLKTSHWMWFIFPQIAGLAPSATSLQYAISSLEEAKAYLLHPILGPRLRECTRLVNLVEGRSIEQIFGYIDKKKFRSSMTLFARATEDN